MEKYQDGLESNLKLGQYETGLNGHYPPRLEGGERRHSGLLRSSALRTTKGEVEKQRPCTRPKQMSAL